MEHEQGILFKEKAKEITPDTSRKAPFLWIKELRFYKELIKDKEPIRQIKLRPGLNILWAKPADKEEVKLRESGIAGHSAGKTLFCRLIRYILGESTFAKSTIQRDIRDKFINSVVVAEVIIDKTHWLVVRPLGLAEKHYAVRNCTIEQIFNNNLPKVSYKLFKDDLNKRVTDRLPLRYFPSTEEPITWDHILPWLSRDQESHLEHIAKWRNSRSESDAINPDTTTNCYIVRGVLGCITDEEQSLIKKNENVKKQKNHLDKQQPLDNFYFKRLKETLPPDILHSDFQLANDLNNILEQKIDDEIKRYKNSYQRSLLELEAPERENPTINLIQTNLQDVRNSIEQKKIEIKQSKGYLALDLNELRVLRKGVPDGVDKPFSWTSMNKAAAPGRCNAPLAEALKKGCVLARENSVDFESIKNLLGKTQEKTDIYKEDIANLRSKIRKLNKELKEFQKHEAVFIHKLNEESKKANLGKNELAKKLSKYSNTIARLEELLKAFETKIETEKDYKKAEQENISLNKKLLETRRKNNDKRKYSKFYISEVNAGCIRTQINNSN